MMRHRFLRLLRRAAMGLIAAAVVCAAMTLTVAPVRADERTCLSGTDAQALVYAGQARKLSELRGSLDGELIRADLCREGAGYVYIVTTLGSNGKVTRRLVDATPSATPPSRPAVAAPMLAVPARPAPAY